MEELGMPRSQKLYLQRMYQKVPALACYLDDLVKMTLFLAPLNSVLLHSLLECEEQKQGTETAKKEKQTNKQNSPAVNFNFSLISAKAYAPFFPLV